MCKRDSGAKTMRRSILSRSGMESEYSFLKIFKFYEVSNKFDVKGGLRQSFINDQRIGHIDK